MVTKWADDATVARRCSQSLIQTCLTTILIAAASVMAGTGDLEVFRVLRFMHGRPRGAVTYGHQMGVHVAIGLLFLGCGMFTLGTSNEALAAMLVAFFPMWPKSASDNRYHLQAFRHLYVLAVESRLVTTRSIYDGSPVQTTVRVLFADSDKEEILIVRKATRASTHSTSIDHKHERDEQRGIHKHKETLIIKNLLIKLFNILFSLHFVVILQSGLCSFFNAS